MHNLDGAMMATRSVAVQAASLSKVYHIGQTQIPVLEDVDLEIDEGDFITISGPSGSGKTTLLNIISGIDKPTKGRVIVFGEDLGARGEDFLADFRCRNLGFVFQSYNLVSTLTVAENIAFPMEWLRKSKDDIGNRVDGLLEAFGLRHRARHFPCQLSGGEQQRGICKSVSQ